MQGHRNKKSKDIYLKLKKMLIDHKELLMPGKEKVWADNMVNIMYSFASNKPTKFGVYVRYAKEEIDELLTHYEQDFCDCCQYLDAEGITRLAQVMYLLKSKSFENIWWRIENRIHELAEVKGSLDPYNISSIMRAFSRSQEN